MPADSMFHKTLDDVSTTYRRARREWEHAMRTGNRDKIDATYSRVQEIEASVVIHLKKPLPQW